MTVQLRPYQRAAVDAIYDYFDRASGHPIVVIPTAGGKSLVMAAFTAGEKTTALGELAALDIIAR